MIKNLELDKENHLELITHCEQKGIGFLSSPFDHKNIDLLNELGLKHFKIPLVRLPIYPIFVKPVVAATLKEVEVALNVLEESGTPNR